MIGFSIERRGTAAPTSERVAFRVALRLVKACAVTFAGCVSGDLLSYIEERLFGLFESILSNYRLLPPAELVLLP